MYYKLSADSKIAKRIHSEPKSWHNNDFQRDKDRVLRCASFRRLQYKTQVFTNNEGDHYRTRLTHSIDVAQIARFICSYLGLNELLSETIALSHDIGHSPFGHAGEYALNKSMQKFGGFDHNAQTLKTITLLEDKYQDFPGLNLTTETLEGIIKHNGPITDIPDTSLNSFFVIDYANKHKLDTTKQASLEAQIAAIADDIAYNNHDIEDGFRAGFLNIQDLSEIDFFKDIIAKKQSQNKNIEDQMLIHDIVRHSRDYMIKDVITQIKSNIIKYSIESFADVKDLEQQLVHFSPEAEEICNKIRMMLKIKVYKNVKVNRMMNKAKRVITNLFELYMNEPGCLPVNWYSKILDINNEIEISKVVSDYIAGMADRYAIKEYSSFFNLSLDDNELTR